MLSFWWMISIYRRNIKQRWKFFFFWGFDFCISGNNISGLQIKSADLGWCNINIMLTREIIFAAQKSISICHNFKDSTYRTTTVKICNVFLDSRRILGIFFYRVRRTMFFSLLFRFAGTKNAFSVFYCIRGKNRLMIFCNFYHPCLLFNFILLKHTFNQLTFFHCWHAFNTSRFGKIF